MKQQRSSYFWLFGTILGGMLLLWFAPQANTGAQPLAGGVSASVAASIQPKSASQLSTLSPYWPADIQQWSDHIVVLANAHGLDPDFIAAVIKEESNGRANLVSPAGAVGLMGVMPSGPGLEWRPPAEELAVPAVNLRWGVGILAEVVRQSGGDLYSALAAYTGGWAQATHRVPDAYATRVLDNYGRAIVVRSGYSPEMASHWTIAVEISRGHVPNEPLLILGSQPKSELRLFGKHIAVNAVDNNGNAFYIIGYAVPLDLVASLDPALGNAAVSLADEIHFAHPLIAETDSEKMSSGNPHLLITCLPSLERLRGQNSTRWFAPSQCPASHR